MKVIRVLTALIPLFAALPASAAIVLYDGFDYGTGSIGTQNGGTGSWSQAWQAPTGAEGVMSVTSGGLSYTGIESVGNKLSDNTNSGLGTVRNFDATGLTDNGSSVWFSALVFVPTSTTGSDLRMKFFADSTVSTGSSAYVNSGAGIFVSGAGGLEIEYNNTTRSASGTTYTKNETFLVIGRMDFSDTAASDSIRIWLNPNTSSQPVDGTSIALSGVDLPTGANNNRFAVRGGGTFQGSVDEIRLGTTFASVIPEPSTYAFLIGLLGVIGVFIFRLRK